MNQRQLLLPLLFSAVAACAQQSEQYSYPLTGHAPYAFAAGGDVTYYHSNGKVYNLRGVVQANVGPVIDFKISPTGESYAVLSGSKGKRSVTLYDLWKKKKVLKTLSLKKCTPMAVCYNGKGTTLMVAGSNAWVYAFNPVKGKLKGDVLQLMQAPTSLTSSVAGQLFAAVHGNTVELWSGKDRKWRKAIQRSSDIRQVDFSQDGQQLAILTVDGTLAVFNTSTLDAVFNADALGDALACRFHPEGKYIAVLTGTGRISIINLLKSDDRQYISVPEGGITHLDFVEDTRDKNVWLVYNTPSQLQYTQVDYLSPLRSKMVADKVQERMAEWEQQLPGESLDAYHMRVNNQTREEQLRAFEQEVMSELAMAECGLAEMKMGSYNTQTGMLAVGMGENLNDLYLDVPEQDLPAFMDASNLEFRNTQYGLNDNDEFELVYADVFNKVTEKTYTYNNTQGQFDSFTPDEAAFTPLGLMQQSMQEESYLAGLTNNIVSQAKEQNLISDHTNISVKTLINPSVDDNGRNVRNYEVGVAYTVDREFSAKEDYAGGRYRIEESNAGTAMLNIVKQALETDFAKYVADGKRLKVRISGTADASAIRGAIKYDGCYGDFQSQPILLDGSPATTTVTQAAGITSNEQLAFLRAVGVKDYLVRQSPAVSRMDTQFEYNISVSKEEGSEHRKVSVELIFEDAFE